MSTTTDDPAAIEREIRRTQDSMSSTVEKIGDQLSVKNVFNALLDKADESNVDVRMLLDGARRNPIALGLIATGAIWLISDKDSKLPTLGSKSTEENGNDRKSLDVNHRDYISHMSAVERRADEDAADYQYRRDLARSNFFMVERNHDEDDVSFRQRLDAVSEKFRAKRQAWADSSADMQAATKKKAQSAAYKVNDLYAANPLVGGILAAAFGAAFGSALPVTRQEKETLGGVGQKAQRVLSEQADQATAKVRVKKDELVEKADATLSKRAASDGDGLGNSTPQADAPFMIGR